MKRWLWVVPPLVAIDWLVKWLAERTLNYGDPLPVLGWLNWTLHYNYGASFGFLNDAGGWQRWMFIGVTVFAVGLMVSMFRDLQPEQSQGALGLSMIVAGAIGNLGDRVLLGYVVDYIHVYWKDWHFPIFNIADCAITIGVILWLMDAIGWRLFGSKREHSS
ncbi:signal peptidase II [Gammaproteobacteria bacterium]|nr:signal peptidase II [Gammaproteobacteria bacterium]